MKVECLDNYILGCIVRWCCFCSLGPSLFNAALKSFPILLSVRGIQIPRIVSEMETVS